MTVSTSRPWRSVLWAWLGMVIFTLVWVAGGLFVGNGKIDADIDAGFAGLPDAVMITVPAGLVAFVMLPALNLALAPAWRRLRSVWARVLLGIALCLPLFVVFVVATKIPERHPITQSPNPITQPPNPITQSEIAQSNNQLPR